MKRVVMATLAAVVMASTSVLAQTPSPARLRGKIDAVTADTVDMTLRNGSKAQVKLPAEIRVTYLTVAKPSDIAEGSYIGTVSVPQPDGSWKALEIQVFPPSMRGTGEGTRDWDLVPQSTMTNGTIGSLVASNGRTIVVTYKGGEKKVLVPDDVPFVSYEPTDRTALTVGSNVIVNGTRAADGSVTAVNINVGKNGLVPPM
jgi:dipeptidyl aminopeptidase/acylaminoacyl peptidase